ncbi:conserved hypothetical protein [delta proteobacterium NaphS2]|nr:conserved hypothetical protein [delta proteobacterium NaphS2]
MASGRANLRLFRIEINNKEACGNLRAAMQTWASLLPGIKFPAGCRF